MKDEQKIAEFTDDDGNLAVDRLVDLQLRHISVLPLGANGRELSAARAARMVEQPRILRLGQTETAINWVADGSVHPDTESAGRSAFARAVAENIAGTQDPAAHIERLENTFSGVLRDEFMHEAVNLYSRAFTETAWNVMYDGEVEDKRGAISAAGSAMLDHVLRLLDGATEFNMGESPPTGDHEVNAETKAALDALTEQVDAFRTQFDARANAQDAINLRAGGLLGHILKANGLEDDYLTGVLGQFSVTGSSPTSSKMGDVAALFGSALSGAVQSSLVTVGNVFNRAKVSQSPSEVLEVVRGEGRELVKAVVGQVSDLMRSPRRRPSGSKSTGPRDFTQPDRIIPGVSELERAMDERFTTQ